MYLLNIRKESGGGVRHHARPTPGASSVTASAIMIIAAVVGIYGATWLTETPLPNTVGAYELTTSDR